jgi:hypothetical protein
MYPRLTALGAGVASAILFALPIKGTFAALLVSLFAPLPTMIVAMGFGLNAGMIACFNGALICALVLHPLIALVYLFTLGLPAWGLGLIAAQNPEAEDRPAWLALNAKPSSLLSWIIMLSIVIAGVSLAFVMAQFDSPNAAQQELSAQLMPLVHENLLTPSALPFKLTPEQITDMIIAALPALMAVWSVLTFALNLWLAARIVNISGLMHRPWPDLPQQLHLPLWMTCFLAVTALISYSSPPLRPYASIGLGASAMGFALHGLALVHALARRSRMRISLLISTYVAHILLIPWPFLLMAVLGMIDAIIALPRVAAPLPPTPPLSQS